MAPDSKSVNYRGGVVTFEIPSAWKEEYDPKGGGTFYEERPDSGTLRLNVLGFTNNAGKSSNEMVEAQLQKGDYDQINYGAPAKRHMVESEEEGVKLHLYRWELLVPVPPQSLRIVILSYTIVAGQEADLRIKEEMEMVGSIIKTARYSQEVGVTGDYHQ
jgi:hypothetical protein